jgi:hypothetical protein
VWTRSADGKARYGKEAIMTCVARVNFLFGNCVCVISIFRDRSAYLTTISYRAVVVIVVDPHPALLYTALPAQ